MKKFCFMGLAALALNSCDIYTSYHPTESVPDALYGEEVATIDSTDNLALLPWQTLFTDPQLQRLIEQGLQNNTDLLTAEQRVKEAEASLLSAKLAYLPSFTLAPQGGVSSFDGAKATWTYNIPVSASWEIDIFGRLRNAKRQAKALLEQSRDYRQAVRTQLIAGIANNYYTLLMLDAQLALAEQTRDSWKETVEATRALMEAGMANEAAVSQMEAIYYAIATSVLDLKDQINTAENSLSLLLRGRHMPSSGVRWRGNPSRPIWRWVFLWSCCVTAPMCGVRSIRWRALSMSPTKPVPLSIRRSCWVEVRDGPIQEVA